MRPLYLDRKRPYTGMDNPPSTANGAPLELPNFPPPVIFKLVDGKVNFREMKIAERDAFNVNLIELSGGRDFRDSNIPRGGDLFVFPRDPDQQKLLLALNDKEVANRKVVCSLPASFSPHHKGVIFGVPPGDSEDEMYNALKDQDVVKVQRAVNREDNGRPLPVVFLFFASGLPSHVKIASVTYEVKRHFPNPYRCKTCWHLGHLSSHCSSATKCKKCGNSHDDELSCSTKCVNCGRPDHEADSPYCPSYLDAKNVIKMSIQNNISIRDARTKYNSLYSRVAQRSSPPTPSITFPPPLRPTTLPQDEFQLLKAQVATLEEKLNRVTETTIPNIAANVTAVQSDLAVIKMDCAGYNARFDTIDRHFIDLKNHLSLLFSALPQPSQPPDPMLAGHLSHSNMLSDPAGSLCSPITNHAPTINQIGNDDGGLYEIEENDDGPY